jgi:hypothetical protein
MARNAAKSGCTVVFMAVWVLGWTAGTLVFDGFVLVNAWRQLRAKGFSIVRGTITDSRVTEDTDSEGGRTYGVEVQYVYTVEEQPYTGDRLRYGETSSNDRYAHTTVADLPIDKAVDVYYDPADPAESLLRPGLEGSDLFMGLFLTPFNVVMLGVWGFGLRSWLARDRAAEAGLPAAHRAKVTLFGPWFAAAVAAGGVSFASIFVVGFSSGFHPPLWLAGGAWVVVLGAAGLAFFWRMLSLAVERGSGE